MNGAAVRCVCHGSWYTTISGYLADHEAQQLELELDVRPPPVRLFVGTFEDGSQVLVEEHLPGRMTVATRPERSALWGPPTFLDETP